MRWTAVAVGALASLCLACAPVGFGPDEGADAGSSLAPDAGGPAAGGAPDAGTPDAGAGDWRACADVFAQEVLPTYRVEISAAERAKLEDEFLHRAEREAAGLDPHPWHPIVFRYRDEILPNAMIRLKGSSSWSLAVERDADPKMQFVIAFNRVNEKGRFHGLRKIALDMPRNDQTFLRQRLALAFLRDLGVPAQCANNARLEINGAYYGLYTNLEAMDKEFLQRVFPFEDDGDLWKSGYELQTNEETATWTRRNALFAARDAATLDALADLEGSLLTWAAEAVLPDGDGYFAGNYNFQLYDHPTRGFLWLPYDLDGTFVNFIPATADPIWWKEPAALEKWVQWSVVLADPTWRDRYLRTLAEVYSKYDVHQFEQWLDSWAAQIREAAIQDPHKPFTLADHEYWLRKLRAYFAERAAFLRTWFQCRSSGGTDADRDGAPWCFDCDEANAHVHPGAPEVCSNARDDDCDGRVDEGCQ
jgi:hypothetical protein